MKNPNNCATCEHKKVRVPPHSWCYMFAKEPTSVCMQHSNRKVDLYSVMKYTASIK